MRTKKRLHPQGDLFAGDTASAKWLALARLEAKRIITRKGYATADDINAIIPFTGISRNVIGSIFKSKEFKSIGFRKSMKPSRKGGIITEWSLR